MTGNSKIEFPFDELRSIDRRPRKRRNAKFLVSGQRIGDFVPRHLGPDKNVPFRRGRVAWVLTTIECARGEPFKIGPAVIIEQQLATAGSAEVPMNVRRAAIGHKVGGTVIDP